MLNLIKINENRLNCKLLLMIAKEAEMNRNGIPVISSGLSVCSGLP